MLNPLFLANSYEQIFEGNKGLLMLVVTVTGILVVFTALVLLIICISLFGKITGGVKKVAPAAKPAAAPKAAPAPQKAAAAAPAAPQSGVSDEIIAVISAAVSVAMGGQSFVIRSVKRSQPAGRSAWRNAGILENTRPF